jgi:hypothetical protein
MTWVKIKDKKDLPRNQLLVLFSEGRFYHVGKIVKVNKLIIVPRLCLEIKDGTGVKYDDLAVDFATYYMLLPHVYNERDPNE